MENVSWWWHCPVQCSRSGVRALNAHSLSDVMPAFSILPNLGFKCSLFVWCLLGSGVSWAGFLHSQGSPILPPSLLEFLSFCGIPGFSWLLLSFFEAEWKLPMLLLLLPHLGTFRTDDSKLGSSVSVSGRVSGALPHLYAYQLLELPYNVLTGWQHVSQPSTDCQCSFLITQNSRESFHHTSVFMHLHGRLQMKNRKSGVLRSELQLE